jgi:hypothetical protein
VPLGVNVTLFIPSLRTKWESTRALGKARSCRLSWRTVRAPWLSAYTPTHDEDAEEMKTLTNKVMGFHFAKKRVGVADTTLADRLLQHANRVTSSSTCSRCICLGPRFSRTCRLWLRLRCRAFIVTHNVADASLRRICRGATTTPEPPTTQG